MAKPKLVENGEPLLKPKLVENDGRSPAREQLAKLIADRDHKRRALQQAETGIENARQFVWEADAELEQATAAVKAARDHHRQLVTKAAISGSRIPSDQTVRDARIAEADAGDRLQVAKDALAALQNLGPLQEALRFAEMEVEGAAKDVIKDEVQDWREQMHQLHEHYIARMSAYSWLTINRIVDDTLPKNVGTPSQLREVESDRHPARIAWQQAFKALCLDADAELPE